MSPPVRISSNLNTATGTDRVSVGTVECAANQILLVSVGCMNISGYSTIEDTNLTGYGNGITGEEILIVDNFMSAHFVTHGVYKFDGPFSFSTVYFQATTSQAYLYVKYNKLENYGSVIHSDLAESSSQPAAQDFVSDPNTITLINTLSHEASYVTPGNYTETFETASGDYRFSYGRDTPSDQTAYYADVDDWTSLLAMQIEGGSSINGIFFGGGV